MADFRLWSCTNTVDMLSWQPAVHGLPRAARLPADGQAFTNDVGESQFKHRWQVCAYPCVLTAHAWRTCCTNKDLAACLSQEMPNQTRVRSDVSEGEGVRGSASHELPTSAKSTRAVPFDLVIVCRNILIYSHSFRNATFVPQVVSSFTSEPKHVLIVVLRNFAVRWKMNHLSPPNAPSSFLAT